MPAMFPHWQEHPRLGLHLHQIPVTFSRVLAAALGKFPPRWVGFAAGRGMEMEPGSPHERRGVKFLMGKQVRAAGCPEEGGQKR